MSRRFKDLNLNSSFLFSAALGDSEICKLVLEIILGRKISKVSVKPEASIMLNSEAKWIRLDIHARDEFSVNYDIESENYDKENIAKRSRYYQSEMDVASLKPGDKYNKLPDSFIIFICTFDPFDRGRYCYTYIEKCVEDGEPLNDGTVKIFLSTKGKNRDEVPQELIHFLEYFENSTDKYVSEVGDESIKKLHQKVSNLKKSREWEEGYMKMEELIEHYKEVAREEGLKEGKEEGLEQGLEQGLQQGLEQGKTLGILQGKVETLLSFLSEKGDISLELKEKIENEKDEKKLDLWIKQSVLCNTVEEFIEQI